jgi:hypothetical protein
MEVNTIRTEGDKIIEIDGLKVLYHYTTNFKDFENVTLRIAQEIRLPFAFAICHQPQTVSGIVVFGRYGGQWFHITNYHEFLIRHLLNNIPHA